MSLSDRLKEERARHAGHAPLQASVREVLAHIAQSGAIEHALGLGEAFPDFLLPDAEGRLVARDALLAQGPFVLAFLRGGWCPYCALAFAALADAEPALAARGARVLVATPETGGRAGDLQHARNQGSGIAVVTDVDHGLAAACGLLYRIPESYAALLGGFGVDLGERQGNSARMLPVPATFLVGADGRVRWRHLDADFTHRAEPSDILAALDAVSGAQASP
jgi:peroxiredoxin